MPMDYPEYGLCNGKRILLAAENETGRKRLECYLVNHSHVVENVTSGEDVVNRMASGVFDCLVLDYGLPGTPFSSVIASLKEVFCYTPIVVMVSNRKCALTRDVATAAPIYLLIKPFTLSDFGSVINSVVGTDGITVTTRTYRSIYNE